jgi:hypothetical protein
MQKVKLKAKSYLRDLGVDEKLILKFIVQKWCEFVDLIHQSLKRDQWLDFVNTGVNLRVT